MSFEDVYEKELSFQTDRRKATVEFIKIVSDLWYDRSIELVLFRNRCLRLCRGCDWARRGIGSHIYPVDYLDQALAASETS